MWTTHHHHMLETDSDFFNVHGVSNSFAVSVTTSKHKFIIPLTMSRIVYNTWDQKAMLLMKAIVVVDDDDDDDDDDDNMEE